MNLFAGLCKRFPTDFGALCGGSQGTFEPLQPIARDLDDRYIRLYLGPGLVTSDSHLAALAESEATLEAIRAIAGWICWWLWAVPSDSWKLTASACATSGHRGSNGRRQARALDADSRDGRRNGRKIVGREFDIGGSEILFEPMQLGRAGDCLPGSVRPQRSALLRIRDHVWRSVESRCWHDWGRRQWSICPAVHDLQPSAA